jgi:hypothetical protein
MKKPKRILSVLAAMVMLLPLMLLAACGSGKKNETKQLESITLSVSNAQITGKGTFDVTVAVTPTDIGEPKDLGLEFTVSKTAEDFVAAVSGQFGRFRVFEAVTTDTPFTITAKKGSVTSNTLALTLKPAEAVVVPLTGLTLTTEGNKSSLVNGENVNFNVAYLPTDTTQTDYTLKFYEADGTTEITNIDNIFDTVVLNRIYQNKNTAKTIKAAAVSAQNPAIISNLYELTLTGESAVNNYVLMASLPSNVSALDIGAGITTAAITAKVYKNSVEMSASQLAAEGKTLSFSSADENVASVSGSDPFTRTLTAAGDGSTNIIVSLSGTGASETVFAKVIVPPLSVAFNTEFDARSSLTYETGKGTANKMPISAVTVNRVGYAKTSAATKFVVRKGGIIVDETEYEIAAGHITFKNTGDYTVTVQSNAGSTEDTNISKTMNFRVNNGTNVTEFAELKSVLETGNRIVNLVGDIFRTTSPHGADIISPTTLAEIESSSIRIFGSAEIYGNEHKIDCSGVALYNKADITFINAKDTDGVTYKNTQYNRAVGNDLYIHQYAVLKFYENGETTVTINDLSIVGNQGFDYARNEYFNIANDVNDLPEATVIAIIKEQVLKTMPKVQKGVGTRVAIPSVGGEEVWVTLTPEQQADFIAQAWASVVNGTHPVVTLAAAMEQVWAELSAEEQGTLINITRYNSIVANTSISNLVDIEYNAIPFGGFYAGIEVAGTKETPIIFNSSNLSIGGFRAGIYLYHVIDSVLHDLTIEDCFIDGMEIKASQVKLTGQTFLGHFGSGGIEMVPSESNQAGIGGNAPNTLLFDNEMTSINNISNAYTELRALSGITIPQIIIGNILRLEASGMTPEKKSNITQAENAGTDLNIIGYILHDIDDTLQVTPSVSQMNNAWANEVIEFSDITGIDTTHKYIKFEIIIPQLGNVSIGYVIVANLNYVG